MSAEAKNVGSSRITSITGRLASLDTRVREYTARIEGHTNDLCGHRPEAPCTLGTETAPPCDGKLAEVEDALARFVITVNTLEDLVTRIDDENL